MRAWIKLVAIKPERKEWIDLKDANKKESELEIQIWLNKCHMVMRPCKETLSKEMGVKRE